MQAEPIGLEIPVVARATPPPRFERLVFTEPRSLSRGRSATLAVSVFAHSLGIAALIILPILFADVLSAPHGGVRAFFVTPVQAGPPPPPPPAPGARAVAGPSAAPHREELAKLAAPVETPTEVVGEEGIALGVEGGVSGGVEGGVAGGVVGGIVGGLPEQASPPHQVVRVGGVVKAPKQVRRVEPEYPELAKRARLTAVIILEATVDTGGRVREVALLRGHPLFDDAAVAAVRQWVYAPLLLDGIPNEFLLTVTLRFDLMNAPAP